MKKRTSDNMWIPFWIDKWIFGSMRIECNLEERAIWIDLLAWAAKDNGYIRANEETPYPLEQLAGMLIIPKEKLEAAIEKFIKTKKIKRFKNGVLYVTTWEKYQFSDRYRRMFKQDSSPKTEQPSEKRKLYNIKEKNIKEKNIKEKNIKEKPSFKYKKKHLDEAKYLESTIKETNPKHTIRGKSYLENWANTFRIMEEKKEASLEEIRLVIDFAMGSSFWHSNILSAGKLREQFGRLWEQAKEKGKIRSDLKIGKRTSKQTPKEQNYWKDREEKITELTKKGLSENEIQIEISKWSKKYWETQSNKGGSRISFLVPDEVWKLAVHVSQQNDIICLRCFARLADERGVEWDKDIKFYPCSRITQDEIIKKSRQYRGKEDDDNRSL